MMTHLLIELFIYFNDEAYAIDINDTYLRGWKLNASDFFMNIWRISLGVSKFLIFYIHKYDSEHLW